MEKDGLVSWYSPPPPVHPPIHAHDAAATRGRCDVLCHRGLRLLLRDGKPAHYLTTKTPFAIALDVADSKSMLARDDVPRARPSQPTITASFLTQATLANTNRGAWPCRHWLEHADDPCQSP